MSQTITPFNFYRTISEELDPERLQRKFLSALLDLQNVERGSIWVRRGDGYQCVEAVGSQSESIKGIAISARRPSIVGWVIKHGSMTVAEPGKDDRHFKEVEDNITVKSRLILCFPLFLKSGEVYGAVQLIDTSAGGNRLNLNQDYLELLQHLVDIGAMALSNSLVYSDQVRENEKLKQALEALRSQEVALGRSPAFIKVMKLAEDYARTDFPVLITGESGTGKELIAREIHRLSCRQGNPFLVQNCSAIPDTLLESELFGYEKGAFTGAVKSKTGIFEAADGGTIFLDEIGDMPLALQARILRVVQYNEIKPLGENRPRSVNVRIISATNKDLNGAIAGGTFREDLFYRLNVLPIHIPPLRERREDIPLLLDHFLAREALRLGIPARRLSPGALEYVCGHPWQGNIRELENFVRHIIVVSTGETISREELALHFPSVAPSSVESSRPAPSVDPVSTGKGSPPASFSFEGFSWEELERAYILYLLEKNRWHITRAAREAGVNRSTFDSRMKRLSIRK